MTGRKLMLLGVLALFGLLAFDADAQAGRRKRRSRDCDCSAPPPPCNTCGASGFYAPPSGGVPLNMPKASGAVIPGEETVDGTRIPPTNVTPAAGTVVPAGGVIPASNSYYYDPRTGFYYPRTAPGAIQGTSGTVYTYPYSDTYLAPVNYTGRRVGRIFRR